MSDCCADRGKTKIIKIDFGRVNAGAIAKKTVKILNEGCKKQYYHVQRDPKSNPLEDRVFTFEFNDWFLTPGSSVECKIEYQPTIPFHYNIDYFSIANCDCICYKITVQGTCIGPNVIPSVSRLLMICPKDRREVKKRLQLTNKSKMTAIFMFDIDPTHCPFKLDVLRGTIGSNSHTYVTITFSPQEQGLLALYLPCLIHHQGPVVTELYGYQGPLFSKPEEFVPLIFREPEPLITNFEGYMSDSVKIMQGSYPPISISANFLDFGKGEFDTKKTCRSVPQNVCFANHTTTDLIVKWDEDPECIFDVKPRSATIRGQQSGLFEVYFLPNKPDALFSKELFARAAWEAKITDASSGSSSSPPVPIPLITSVRMIGQSFSPESIGWIPQYKVPQTVTLPPCLPLVPVYTTFLIKLYGHLPITFRFIPPPTTNFTVKPMVGIIHREYQIVALQVFPKIDSEFVYIERWAIQFNGNSKNEVPIEFRAYAEYPKLDFNENNVVEFAPVHPRCEQVVQVGIRNTTRHCIRYSFPDLPSDISLEESSGIIQANETLKHDWTFSPKEIGDYNYTVCCCLQMLKAGNPVGPTNNISLKVRGRAQHGYLVALPEEVNFGSVQYGQTKMLSFHAFNFSSVKIHCKLTCRQRGWPTGEIDRDIKVLPVAETINPGCKERIDIYLTPREPGFHQLMVQYTLRPNSLAKDTLCGLEPRDICALNCMCILPGFQIKDLLYFSLREHISKVLLWNLLEIDKFNATANSILPGKEKIINIRFPELVLSQDPLIIKLLILNSTSAQSTWTLTRVKKCDCQQVVKTRGLTFKYKEYSCDHRLACAISPKRGVLQPHGEAIIAIKVCYILPGKTSLQWQLKLSDNRKIMINADVVALSDLEVCPSLLYNQILSLEKIYLGDMDAVNQMCWMYNSMDHEVTYSIDTGPLRRINTRNLSEVFSCRNPQGSVPGRSCYPIMFKFQPRRFESYRITVPLKLGNRWTDLSIEAETDVSPKTRFFPGKVPRLDKFSIPELPVYFSVDHIVVSPMPMHSTVNRMIMISNESKNDVIGYQWKSYNMPNILEIKAMPTSGRIQPTKAQSFRITIRSLSHPCKITGALCCQFLNLGAQSRYEKSIIVYSSLCKELAGQFIITEKGTTEPKPWLEPVEKPKPFYKSLSIGCYIYSSMDTDLKATVEEQLKSLPPAEIRIRRNECCTVTDKKMIDIAGFILEGMIWDILNSNMFFNDLKESLVKVSDVKYGQYTIPLMQRRNLEDRSYNIPSKQLLGSIFEEMILGIVHEEFGLSVHHMNRPEDIRQFCYQNRDPRSSQQSRMYKSNVKGDFQSFKTNQLLKSEEVAKVKLKEIYLESQVKFNVEVDSLSSESIV